MLNLICIICNVFLKHLTLEASFHNVFLTRLVSEVQFPNVLLVCWAPYVQFVTMYVFIYCIAWVAYHDVCLTSLTSEACFCDLLCTCWTLNWNSQCVFWQSVVRNMCFTTYLQNVHQAAPIAQNALFCSAFHLEDSFFKTYGHHGTNGWGRWSPTTQKHIRRIMRSGIAGPCEQISQNRCSAELNVLYQPLQILLIARNDDSLPPCDYVLVAVCLCNVIFWKPGISITIEYTL
jgi:hypothetical protein